VAETRSQDYRVVFANTFNVTMGPTELHLICGIQHNMGTDDPGMEAQVGLVTTHQAARVLQDLLTLLLDEHESQIGRKIDYDPHKFDDLREQINANRRATGRPPLQPSGD